MKENKNEQILTCPKCGATYPISEAITDELEQKIKEAIEAEYKDKFEKREKEIEAKTKSRFENDFKVKIADLENQVKEKDEKITELNKKELELLSQERALKERENKLEIDFEKKLKEEREKIESLFKKQKDKIEERIKSEIEKNYSVELGELRKQVEDKNEALNIAKKKELELMDREEKLRDKEKNLEVELQKKIQDEKLKIEQKVKAKTQQEISIEMQDMKNQVSELKGKLDSAQKNELDLLKRQRELEDAKKEFELEKEREMLNQREKLFKEAKEKADAENVMRLREKEELIKSMQKTIEELKNKSERGSQQLQGEVQELELEDFLRDNFSQDDIEPVPKGKRGADVIQKVKNQFGQICGSIIWESKRTKNWSDGWIGKLKDDQREAKSDIAVIVSQAMPAGISHIGQKENVWIVNFESTPGIVIALREQLIQINQLRSSEVGKNQKMESIYHYLCSNEFKQRIEAIVETFISMNTDLESEKRAYEKQWAKREKQITNVIKNTSGMYGDLQALIGSALPEVKQLALPGGLQEDEIGISENDELPF